MLKAETRLTERVVESVGDPVEGGLCSAVDEENCWSAALDTLVRLVEPIESIWNAMEANNKTVLRHNVVNLNSVAVLGY